MPTPDNPDGNTSPARLSASPTSRIDYDFVSAQVTVGAAYVPIDDQTRLASDHYPVVAAIAVPGAAVGIKRKEFSSAAPPQQEASTVQRPRPAPDFPFPYD